MKKILIVSALVLALLPIMAVYHKLGDFDTPGSAMSVKVSGNYAYIADNNFGLAIIDIADSHNPSLVSSYGIDGNALSVAVVDNLVYVDTLDSLMIFDVTNPYAPSLLGAASVPTGGQNTWENIVTVSGNIAYVLSNHLTDPAGAPYYFLNAVDVSDPQNPTLIGSYDDYGGIHTRSISVVNGIAYLAGRAEGGALSRYPQGLQIIDVSIPQNPTWITSYPCDAFSATVDNNIAYVVAGDSLLFIDVSVPQNPTLIDSYTMPDDWNYYSMISISVSEGVLYIADNVNGLRTINVTSLQDPFLISSYTCQARSASFANGIAWITASNILWDYYSNNWFEIIDISNAQNPALLGSYDTPGTAYSVSKEGSTLYIADGDSGLQIINIQNPLNPVWLGSFDTSGTVMSSHVSGNTAYVADGYGLHIVDVNDPQNPVHLGYLNTVGLARSIDLADTIAILANGWSIKTIDVSNPQLPVLLGSCNTPGQANYVVTDGIKAFIADGNSGLCIVNFINPQHPVQIASWYTAGNATCVSLHGNYIYMADGEEGLQVFNVTDPYTPILACTVPPYHGSGNIVSCYVQGDLLFVSDDWWNEISVYDISVPQTPVLLNRYAWNLITNGMLVAGDVLYTANGHFGLSILDLGIVDVNDPVQIPHSAFQMRNYPNPFNPETTLAYTLPAAGSVSLEIFNSRGQLIKSLLHQEQLAGEHSLIWNGKDDFGHIVASGLYLCRIACNGKHETRKMLLLK